MLFSLEKCKKKKKKVHISSELLFVQHWQQGMQNSPHDICYDYYVKFSAEQGQQQPPILKYTPVSIWTCLISTYRPSTALLVDFKDTGFPTFVRVPFVTAGVRNTVFILYLFCYLFFCALKNSKHSQITKKHFSIFVLNTQTKGTIFIFLN